MNRSIGHLGLWRGVQFWFFFKRKKTDWLLSGGRNAPEKRRRDYICGKRKRKEAERKNFGSGVHPEFPNALATSLRAKSVSPVRKKRGRMSPANIRTKESRLLTLIPVRKIRDKVSLRPKRLRLLMHPGRPTVLSIFTDVTDLPEA